MWLGQRRAAIADLLLVVALSLGRIGTARAQDNPREAAREHYEQGLKLAGQNGYEAALDEFNRAYAISPQFAVLYNIAQCQVALGHPAEAIEALTKYLREGGDHVPPDRRALVESQIARLGAQPADRRQAAREHYLRGLELLAQNG